MMDKIIVLGSGKTMIADVYNKLKEMELSNENFPIVEDVNKARIENKMSFDDFADLFSKITFSAPKFEDVKEDFERLCIELKKIEVPKIGFEILKSSSVNPNERNYKNKRKW